MSNLQKRVGVGQIAKHDERIIYVEPNDVYGSDANRNDLTPNYEDFCISFNLIIETFSRFKNSVSSGTSKGNKYSIEWGMDKSDLLKSRTSVLKGTTSPDNKDYNFLTTYYTDLSTKDVIEKSQIEGLGVESVQISYESWYTPTVVIKFIDVRGSALFGREEAIHVDEKLTADNIFGSFFTFPYPLFRLQVKGFLGKPVTYQLTCSNFRGEFNPNTGNFEATVTFIGYSWSLLTDIPLTYLVAAPYANYKGREYWERKSNSKEWGLWSDDGTYKSPPKLKELFRNIDRADTQFEEMYSSSSPKQNEELRNVVTEKDLLGKIKSGINDLVDMMKSLPITHYILQTDNDTNVEQLVLFSNSETFNLPNKKNIYEELEKNVKEYVEKFNSNIISLQKIAVNKSFINGQSIKFNNIFNVVTDTNGSVTNINLRTPTGKTIRPLDNANLESWIINDSQKIIKPISKTIINDFTNNPNLVKERNYVYVFTLGDFRTSINDRLKQIAQHEQKLSEDISSNIEYEVVKLLGFKPYIGNIFKVIFCHLETFCHIMFDSATEIYQQTHGGLRKPKVLGVNLNQTDILKGVKDDVPPWPAVYNGGVKTKECGYVSELNNVYAWVGDFSNKFIEQKVVYSIQEGVQEMMSDKALRKSIETSNSMAIAPTDYLLDKNIFYDVRNVKFPELAGYLSIRAALLLGVLSGNNIKPELAKTLGKLDANNYFICNPFINELKGLFSGRTIQDIKNISYCNTDLLADVVVEGTNEKYYSFETSKKIKKEYNNFGRCPMFKKDGNKNIFVHWYDKNGNGLLPTTLKQFRYYGDDIIYNYVDDNNIYFDVNYSDNKRFINEKCVYNSNTKSLAFVPEKNKEDYMSTTMFRVIQDANEIVKIKGNYDNLKGGNYTIGERKITEDLTNYLTTFLRVSNSDKSKYFQNVSHMLSANTTTLGLDKTKLVLDVAPTTPTYDISYDAWSTDENKNLKNEVTINNDCTFSLNGVVTDINSLVVQQSKFYEKGYECNLFGSPFYYLQNNKVRDEKDNLRSYRVSRVKALLFLHTFQYDYANAKINCFSNNKKTGGLEVVPKAYLLLIAGLLWRQQFKGLYGYDPIIWKDVEKGANYKQAGIDYTLFVKDKLGDKTYDAYSMSHNSTLNYDVQISHLLGGASSLDVNIRHQLVLMFDDFVNNTFNKIANLCELKNKYDKRVFEYTYQGIKSDIKLYYQLLSELRKNKRYVHNFDCEQYFTMNGTAFNEGVYSSMLLNTTKKSNDNQGFKLLFNELNLDLQTVLKDLYFNDYIIMDSCYKRFDNVSHGKSEIIVNDTLYDAYLNGFFNEINNIIAEKTVKVDDLDELQVSKEVLQNRDLSLSIYYYLKNLWDRWLVAADENEFDVVNFFNKNFVFMDSFYRNTYHNLAINCQEFYNAWNERDDNATLFHFISNICTKHGCMWLPVADFVSFNGKREEYDIEMMENLFRPMPFNEIPSPSTNNKFVVVYVQPFSRVSTEDNAIPMDSYDIWSHNKFTDTSKNLFKKVISTNDKEFDKLNEVATAEGYNVPSFGVAFSRQNNHIFKNIRAAMDNPAMTEQAIKAESNIARMGSGGGRKVCFVGQDIFNVFSNYSYSVELKMIGNAQISPLMYFQLMNVPLWKGTYMIYKVEHNMSVGDMETTVTGMKMSKFATPFNSKFFNVKLDIDQNYHEEVVDEGSVDECSFIPDNEIRNPNKDVIILDKNAYNLILKRYNKVPSGKNDGHEAIEGVIYEYGTNKIITWTIEDSVDSERNFGKFVNKPLSIVAGGRSWPRRDGGYREGCSSYCASLAKGMGGFGRNAGDSNTMLCVKEQSGCLFHPGADTTWSNGCILCGDKANNGRRSFDIKIYHKENIANSTSPSAVWYRSLYDNVVPKLCNGKKVNLYIVNDFNSIKVKE